MDALQLRRCSSRQCPVIEQLLAEEIDPTQWLNFRQTIDPVEVPQTGY